MVHRIQNRNPGYSEPQNSESHQSFNFSSSTAVPISEGATALKLDNEVQEETVNEFQNFEQSENDTIENSSMSEAILDEVKIEEKTETSEELKDSNGLENFGIEEDNFELFNSDNEENSSEQSLDVSEETSPDEDDLEIPAFLRRQKN